MIKKFNVYNSLIKISKIKLDLYFIVTNDVQKVNRIGAIKLIIDQKYFKLARTITL